MLPAQLYRPTELVMWGKLRWTICVFFFKSLCKQIICTHGKDYDKSDHKDNGKYGIIGRIGVGIIQEFSPPASRTFARVTWVGSELYGI